MDKIVIQGGKRLMGKVQVQGAKNTVLPIIAASILGESQTSIIHDVPHLDDVSTLIEIVQSLGIQTHYENGTLTIQAEEMNHTCPPAELVQKMRASFLLIGPLLARKGQAKISMPGGCAIGSRPIDQHLKGFEAMGAEISVGNGYIYAFSKGRLQGAKIYLDIPSVGATENIMMAATLAEGTTVIDNAAQEPEIVDLANYLNAMGAKIRGAGTGSIRIEGVSHLRGVEYTVIPDRIEAGTYMIAAAMTRGDVFVEGAIAEHLNPLISKLKEMGAYIEESDEGVRVRSQEYLKSVDIKTLPHPGFPTDLQPQMMALLLTSEGTSVITETVFENRFQHVDEFKKMNAQVKIEGRTAIIQGNVPLTGSQVRATDLRAGAALVLAGLVAEGITEVHELHHIDRGYVGLVENLQHLGAHIYRSSVPHESKASDVKV